MWLRRSWTPDPANMSLSYSPVPPALLPHHDALCQEPKKQAGSVMPCMGRDRTRGNRTRPSHMSPQQVARNQ